MCQVEPRGTRNLQLASWGDVGLANATCLLFCLHTKLHHGTVQLATCFLGSCGTCKCNLPPVFLHTKLHHVPGLVVSRLSDWVRAHPLCRSPATCILLLGGCDELHLQLAWRSFSLQVARMVSCISDALWFLSFNVTLPV